LNIFKNIVYNKFNIILLSVTITLSVTSLYSQDQINEDFSTTNIELDNPSSIVENYIYDPVSDRYFFNQSVGNFNINYPIILSPKEYEELVLNENLKIL